MGKPGQSAVTGDGVTTLAAGGVVTAPPTPESRFAASKLAAHIQWCAIDGAVFVLDTRAGDYLALAPDAARQWLAQFGGGMPDDAGITNLLAVLRRRGWLAEAAEVPSASSPAPCRPPRYPRLYAYQCLVRAAWKLRRGGFAAAYGWAQSSVCRAAAPPNALPAAIAAFHRAEQLVLSRRGLDDCLPRSLALFVFLHRCGFQVRHRIGVRRYPFAAHAWVEYGATVLLDPAAAEDAGFVPLAALG